MVDYKDIEKSIIKTYKKTIYSRFLKAIKDYQLIKENDKILVCISGGKDSFLLAKCMQELLRHSKYKFELYFAVMNPGYTENNLIKIKENAKLLNIPIEIFDTNIFEVANKLNPESPCYMCARMRRGYLYNRAKELGCNKIALGHHFDDVIETTLLSMIYGAEFKTMMPKLYSDNFEGLELIRPLYLVRESDIINWKNYNGLDFINCACKFTSSLELDASKSKRREMKELVKHLKSLNPDADYNIFKSLDNVNLSCVLGTKKDKEYHNFLEFYDD